MNIINNIMKNIKILLMRKKELNIIKMSIILKIKLFNTKKNIKKKYLTEKKNIEKRIKRN